MAKLTIRSATDLVKYFGQEPSLNPPKPRRHYDENDDKQYLAITTSQREQESRELAALEEDLNPETLEPFGIDELITRQGPASYWDRTYGRDAADFGNYIDFLRSH